MPRAPISERKKKAEAIRGLLNRLRQSLSTGRSYREGRVRTELHLSGLELLIQDAHETRVSIIHDGRRFRFDIGVARPPIPETPFVRLAALLRGRKAEREDLDWLATLLPIAALQKGVLHAGDVTSIRFTTPRLPAPSDLEAWVRAIVDRFAPKETSD